MVAEKMAIAELQNRGSLPIGRSFDFDLAYGDKGAIQKRMGVDTTHKFDKLSKSDDVIEVDFVKEDVPLASASQELGIFDPPTGVRRVKSKKGVSRVAEAQEIVRAGIKASARILKKGGKLFVKSQDQKPGSGGVRMRTTENITRTANESGMHLTDVVTVQGTSAIGKSGGSPGKEVHYMIFTKLTDGTPIDTKGLGMRGVIDPPLPDPSVATGRGAFSLDRLGRHVVPGNRLATPSVEPGGFELRIGPPAEVGNRPTFLAVANPNRSRLVMTAEEITSTLSRSENPGALVPMPRTLVYRPQELLDMTIPQANAVMEATDPVKFHIMIIKDKPRNMQKFLKAGEEGTVPICSPICSVGNAVDDEYQWWGIKFPKLFNVGIGPPSRKSGIFAFLAPRISAWGENFGHKVVIPLWNGTRQMESSMSKYAKIVNESIADPKFFGILRDYKVLPNKENGKIISEILLQMDRKGKFTGKVPNMTPELIHTARTFRKVYEAAGKEFGITEAQFIQGYLPKVKASVKSTIERIRREGLTEGVGAEKRVIATFDDAQMAEIERVVREHTRITQTYVRKGDVRKPELTVEIDPIAMEGLTPEMIDAIRHIKLESKNLTAQYLGYKPEDEAMRFFAEFERTGKLMNLEDDAFQLINIYLRAGSQRKYIGRKLDELRPHVDKFFDNDSAGSAQFADYVDRLRGKPTDTEVMLNNSIDKVLTYFGAPQLAGDRPSMVAASILTDLVYMGALGLRLASPLKNLTQTNLTAGEIGYKHVLKAVREIFTHPQGRAGVAAEMKAAGVYTLPIDRIITDDIFMGPFRQSLNQVQIYMLRLFVASDRLNRSIAYYGARSKFKEMASGGNIDALYFTGNKALQAKTKGMFGGPKIHKSIQRDIQAMMKTGDIDSAAQMYALRVTQDTQYVYGSANSPALFSQLGPVGRMLGVFATWPLNYSRLLTNWVRGGRGDAITTHLLSSVMMAKGAGELFNADISNWFLFGAMPTGPTPFLGMALDTTKAAFLTGKTGFQTITVGSDPVAIKDRNDSWKSAMDRISLLVPGNLLVRDSIRLHQGEIDFQQWAWGFKPIPKIKQVRRAAKARKTRRETKGQ